MLSLWVGRSRWVRALMGDSEQTTSSNDRDDKDDDQDDKDDDDGFDIYKIEKFAPNKPPNPKEISEVGRPYNLMGSGASPEVLKKLHKELEATYKEPIVPGAPPYKPQVQVEYVPDRVEVDPYPPCMREMFFKNDVGMPPHY